MVERLGLGSSTLNLTPSLNWYPNPNSQSMEQHPVPQHIAAFKFKLFGNLTAKQFITLAIPLSVALLIFFSPLPPIIRLPLSFVIGIFAFVVALVPIGGRSADQWTLAFIKAILSPTQRIWVKEKEIPEFLNISTSAQQEEEIPEDVKRMGKEKLVAFLKSLPKESETSLDIQEQMALENIDFNYQMPIKPQIVKFQESKTAQPATEGKTVPFIRPLIEKPQPLKIQQPTPQIPKVPSQDFSKIGTFPPPISWAPTLTYGGNYNYEIALQTQAPSPFPISPQPLTQPKIATGAKPYILPGVEKRLARTLKSTPIEPEPESPKIPSINLASGTNFSIENIIPIRMPDNKIKFLHGIGKTRVRKLHFAPPANFDLSKLPIRGEKRFEISEALKRHLNLEEEAPAVVLPTDIWEKEAKKKDTPLKKPSAKSLPIKTVQVPKSTHSAKIQDPKKQAQAQKSIETAAFSPQFAQSGLQSPNQAPSRASIIPLTSMPNVISGLVTTTEGIPLSGAVLVIRDAFGIPQRALKTNKLGQFLSATPLANGAYTVETESEEAVFEPTTLEAKNQIIAPIEIRATQTKAS